MSNFCSAAHFDHTIQYDDLGLAALRVVAQSRLARGGDRPSGVASYGEGRPWGGTVHGAEAVGKQLGRMGVPTRGAGTLPLAGVGLT